MILREFFDTDVVNLDLKGESKDEILKELISTLELDEKSEGILFKMLKRRENLGSTGIGRGIAIPHCRSLVVNRLRIAFGRKKDGIDFNAIDDQPVQVDSEYLLAPGIHRVALTSERYQDQALTVGVEQGHVTSLRIPLLLALATVNYTAPRGSRVYVDGTALDAESGDFTAVPGEHTIVVVVGDYTVTRRFSVAEGREYNLAVTMGVAIEEAK